MKYGFRILIAAACLFPVAPAWPGILDCQILFAKYWKIISPDPDILKPVFREPQPHNPNTKWFGILKKADLPKNGAWYKTPFQKIYRSIQVAMSNPLRPPPPEKKYFLSVSGTAVAPLTAIDRGVQALSRATTKAVLGRPKELNLASEIAAGSAIVWGIDKWKNATSHKIITNEATSQIESKKEDYDFELENDYRLSDIKEVRDAGAFSKDKTENDKEARKWADVKMSMLKHYYAFMESDEARALSEKEMTDKLLDEDFFRQIFEPEVQEKLKKDNEYIPMPFEHIKVYKKYGVRKRPYFQYTEKYKEKVSDSQVQELMNNMHATLFYMQAVSEFVLDSDAWKEMRQDPEYRIAMENMKNDPFVQMILAARDTGIISNGDAIFFLQEDADNRRQFADYETLGIVPLKIDKAGKVTKEPKTFYDLRDKDFEYIQKLGEELRAKRQAE